MKRGLAFGFVIALTVWTLAFGGNDTGTRLARAESVAPLSPLASATPLAPASRVDPALAATLKTQPAGQPVSAIVILQDQVDVRALGGRNRAERGGNVERALRGRADATQVGLRTVLAARRTEGHVREFTPLWIINAVAMRADRSVIDELARRPEVRSIVPDAIIQAPVAPRSHAATTDAVEPNIGVLNAPLLWDLGYQGQGVVVASLDTGVDNTHPDLAAQWRGGSNSWYDPYGQYAQPVDISGHGTWTMGLIVGGAAGGTSIGVAPRARWIAAKIFDNSGLATASAIHRSFQWLLDPDGDPLTSDVPNLVNSSWAFGNPGCHLDFEPDLQSLVAVGITPVFAAGNDGPFPMTSDSPADNPDALAAGAVDNHDLIASFSSRGPNACDPQATFPSVVAPGVNVKTADLYGLYAYVSGTSFAAPHVTGALALLLSAFPTLTVAQQELSLSATAVDLGPAGLDNTYGAGRIDVLAAYTALVNGTLPTPTATALPTATITPTLTVTPTATGTPLPTPTDTPVSHGPLSKVFLGLISMQQ